MFSEFWIFGIFWLLSDESNFNHFLFSVAKMFVESYFKYRFLGSGWINIQSLDLWISELLTPFWRIKLWLLLFLIGILFVESVKFHAWNRYKFLYETIIDKYKVFSILNSFLELNSELSNTWVFDSFLTNRTLIVFCFQLENWIGKISYLPSNGCKLCY